MSTEKSDKHSSPQHQDHLRSKKSSSKHEDADLQSWAKAGSLNSEELAHALDAELEDFAVHSKAPIEDLNLDEAVEDGVDFAEEDLDLTEEEKRQMEAELEQERKEEEARQKKILQQLIDLRGLKSVAGIDIVLMFHGEHAAYLFEALGLKLFEKSVLRPLLATYRQLSSKAVRVGLLRYNQTSDIGPYEVQLQDNPNIIPEPIPAAYGDDTVNDLIAGFQKAASFKWSKNADVKKLLVVFPNFEGRYPSDRAERLAVLEKAKLAMSHLAKDLGVAIKAMMVGDSNSAARMVFTQAKEFADMERVRTPDEEDDGKTPGGDYGSAILRYVGEVLRQQIDQSRAARQKAQNRP